MDSINQIKLNLEKAKAQRLSQESTKPKTRHTIYLGDRVIQQLGQSPIENGVILNNQSIKIGDPMLPLAKGNVLRRVDNTNGGALLGSAYRDAVENDFDINGDRRNRELSRNGGDPSSPSTGLNYPVYPPPFGCVPPPQQCFWSTNPIAPDGFQGYGDAVLNENALPLYLYCQNGIQPPDDLGCTFLNKGKWGCFGGVCLPTPEGLYNSQAECESSLRWNVEIFTLGICQPGLPPNNCVLNSPPPNTLVRIYNISNAQYPISIIIDNRIPPGFIGYNHYKFVDALNVEIEYIAASSAGYYAQYSKTCPI